MASGIWAVHCCFSWKFKILQKRFTNTAHWSTEPPAPRQWSTSKERVCHPLHPTISTMVSSTSNFAVSILFPLVEWKQQKLVGIFLFLFHPLLCCWLVLLVGVCHIGIHAMPTAEAMTKMGTLRDIEDEGDPPALFWLVTPRHVIQGLSIRYRILDWP